MGRRRFRQPAGWLMLWALAANGCSTGSIENPFMDPRGQGDSSGAGPRPGLGGSSGAGGNSGRAGGSGPQAGTAAAGCSGAACEGESPVASSAFPRLSHRQWAASTRDLLFLDSAPDISGFTNDAPSSTSFDNNGDTLVVSPDLAGDYEVIVEKLASELVASPARLAKVGPASWPTDPDGEARSFVTTFGERAFRRPLTAAEVTTYVALFKRGSELVPGVATRPAGVQLTVQAMLLAPAFLYRIELGQGKAANGAIDLTDHEIATRLSYMLWDSIPDAPLLAAAAKRELHDPAKLATHAQRMLADPRAGEKLEEFHRQLLEVRNYDTLHPAGLPADIGRAMREETERFVRDVVVERDGGLSELLTATYTFLNDDLAALYGMSGSFGDELTRVELDPEQRAGLLTQPGFLTYRSGDTAPILRGVFVNHKFLCAELPPPPVFEPPKLMGDTRRKRIDSVTGAGTCGASCHQTMINPAGFPLEYFDDAGRFRTKDNGQAIDGSASYRFRDGVQAFDGPVEWAQTIDRSAEAHECYVRHWLEFGFGRREGDGDAALIARVAQASRASGLSAKEILVSLVQSPTFRTRATEQP
jgi:hypothetical protein